MAVLGGNVKLNSVNIKFSNNHEITVLTSKTKVSDILEENHITLGEKEVVTPGIDAEITDEKAIVISVKGEEPTEVAKNVKTEIITEEVKAEYSNIKEEILVVIEKIPFETITKDVSNGSATTRNQIIQQGVEGERKVTYKVTYKDDVEISREELSSEVTKEPVDKIVQIQTKSIISSRSCSCAICCGKTNGITASGAKATANHTIAAPSTFAFGTQVVINGVTYTVEDRGGAIQGNRIDVYMNSHKEALQWGVKYLEVEVLN